MIEFMLKHVPLIGRSLIKKYVKGCVYLTKTTVELAFYLGTFAFLCTWLDLSRGSTVSAESLTVLQTAASLLVFTSWFLHFLDGKVTSWEYTTMFLNLVRKLIGLFRTFSALFIGFFLAFGILWKSYGHQDNQGVNLVKVKPLPQRAELTSRF